MATTAVANPTTSTIADSPANSVVTATGDFDLPQNFGDDHRFVWDEIQRTFDWLALHPEPELLDLVIAAECTCFEGEVERFTELRDNGWTYTGDSPAQTVEFKVEVIISEDSVGAVVLQRSDADAIVDAEGMVIESFAPWESEFAVTLIRGDDGRWRVSEVVGR